MARTTHPKKKPDVHSDRTSREAVRCRLFSDIVSEHLCLLRKKELDAKGAFSCHGCPMDAIMQQQLRIMKEVLGIGGR